MLTQKQERTRATVAAVVVAIALSFMGGMMYAGQTANEPAPKLLPSPVQSYEVDNGAAKAVPCRFLKEAPRPPLKACR